MRVLVVGGFGYIGGRLSSYLAEQGYDVIIGSQRSLPAPFWLPHAEVRLINYQRKDKFEQICSDIDVVIHAAGMNSMDCTKDPSFALKFNAEFPGDLASSADKGGVKRFIYLSTAHVYANPLEGEFDEKSLLTNNHPYATSHAEGEKSVLRACEKKNMTGVVVRLSNAFGYPMQDNVNCWTLLVNDLVKQAVKFKEMTINNNPQQKRDFISLTEVCKVISKLIDFNGLSDRAPIYNLGSGDSISLLDMALEIKILAEKILNSRVMLKHKIMKSQSKPLIYRIEALERDSIYVNSDRQAELISLINYCKK